MCLYHETISGMIDATLSVSLNAVRKFWPPTERLHHQFFFQAEWKGGVCGADEQQVRPHILRPLLLEWDRPCTLY